MFKVTASTSAFSFYSLHWGICKKENPSLPSPPNPKSTWSLQETRPCGAEATPVLISSSLLTSSEVSTNQRQFLFLSVAHLAHWLRPALGFPSPGLPWWPLSATTCVFTFRTSAGIARLHRLKAAPWSSGSNYNSDQTELEVQRHKRSNEPRSRRGG